MHSRIRTITKFLAFLLLGTYSTAYAQTIDASFQATSLYRPGDSRWVAQQADGKYLVVGDFVKSDTGPISQLVRFNTDFTPDQAFNTAVAGLLGKVFSVRVLPAGQLLVVGEGNLTLGGIARQDLLRLNPDGTPDASFDAGTASSTGTGLVVEPASNGQLLVGGEFTQYNGVAHNRLVRLTATGSIDAAFTPPAFADNLTRLAVQTDGKILVGSESPGTGNRPGLVRLNTNGLLDNSFSAITNYVSDLAIQPDGKILIAGISAFAITGSTRAIARLLPNGNLDATFQGSTGFIFGFARADNRRLVLQPDGRIVIKTENAAAPLQLNTNGTLDVSFQSTLPSHTQISSLATTSSGQVLAAGSYFELPNRRNQVVLLRTDGSLMPGFSPVLLGNGRVDAIALQSDGMVIAGGSFDEVNGLSVSNLVRFRIDGTLDAGFTPPAGLDYIRQVVLQPDGKVFVVQADINNQYSYSRLVRLLPTGAYDGSFVPGPRLMYLDKLLLQPDGRLVLVADSVGSTTSSNVIRLFANGRLDRSFRSAAPPNFRTQDAAIQPDGKLVLADLNPFANRDEAVIRLLPSGQPDPNFSPVLNTDADMATNVLIQPDGKIILVDNYYGRVRRLLPNGAFDATFTAYRPSTYLDIYGIATQPNGRLLLSGYPNFFIRLLPDGSLDTSFTSPGLNNRVADFAITPTGQILAGGYFSTVGGQRRMGLVRLNAANVLRVADKQVAASTEVWPNPSHGKLQLALQQSAHPQRVSLFNALGAQVLTQPVALAELTLNTAALAPGVYVLRVDYAAGFVTRRVVLE
jgi:uncharacterized delta-60 repeat protein